jgi:hypothetical protein
MNDKRRTVRYKVFFHQGQELGLKTRVQKGHAWVEDDGLHLAAADGSVLLVPKASLLSSELFRLHRTCTVIRVDYEGGRLFLSVIRFLIGGQLMLVNYYRTVELHRILASMALH